MFSLSKKLFMNTHSTQIHSANSLNLNKVAKTHFLVNVMNP